MELTYANMPRKNWKWDKIFRLDSMIQENPLGKEFALFCYIKPICCKMQHQIKYMCFNHVLLFIMSPIQLFVTWLFSVNFIFELSLTQADPIY